MSENPLRPVRFVGKLYSGPVRLRSASVECVLPADQTQVEFVYDPFRATIVCRDLSCAPAILRMQGEIVRLQIGNPNETRIQTRVRILEVREQHQPRELTIWVAKDAQIDHPALQSHPSPLDTPPPDA